LSLCKRGPRMSKASRTSTVGAPQLKTREGAACNSRPQWGQMTKLAGALTPQRRQRTFCGLGCMRTPHSAQIELPIGVHAPQLGHWCELVAGRGAPATGVGTAGRFAIVGGRLPPVRSRPAGFTSYD
jgi:hypothetical protein